MNKKYIIFAIAVTLVVVIISLTRINDKVPQMPVANPGVTYYCEQGKTIKARFDSESAELQLSDGRSLILPQVRSGSGVRYEKDGIALIGKGNNAFLTERETISYNNCLAATVTSLGNGKNKFECTLCAGLSFEYPEFAILSGGGVGYSTEWQRDTATLGLVDARITLPRERYPHTNFSGAVFQVARSSDPDAYKTCLIPHQGERIVENNLSLDDNLYTKFNSTDAGAGNFYETTSYRAQQGIECNVIEYTVHSTNIGNYSPDQGVTEYKQGEVVGILEDIVKSFKSYKD